ncbi:MAG: geranylgeranylglyceryl/heptaprenylglyceryl phosphate synthase [Candidatus Korarchaeota archaeon NZ13-K]|nr:MAG: geranylgeranylglyceryl/heptaprenylglyceryl phosphate synthase [Candidatus Korarchaeota archaeon NZ13-K]
MRRESAERSLLAVLIDPAKVGGDEARRFARAAAEGGADLIFVGGSIGAGFGLNDVIMGVKEESKLPVILFPGNVDGVSPHADAILFMSLLNSANPYWIIQAQALAAIPIRRMGLEAIPTAYLIVEPGHRSAAGWVGAANPIPRDRPEIALAYALAAEMLGMRWVYLEAGSGAEAPVPPEMVRLVREGTRLGIIVGGGIRSPEMARERAMAGANVIVVGTHFEEGGNLVAKIREMRLALSP